MRESQEPSARTPSSERERTCVGDRARGSEASRERPNEGPGRHFRSRERQGQKAHARDGSYNLECVLAVDTGWPGINCRNETRTRSVAALSINQSNPWEDLRPSPLLDPTRVVLGRPKNPVKRLEKNFFPATKNVEISRILQHLRWHRSATRPSREPSLVAAKAGVDTLQIADPPRSPRRAPA